jgi:NAD(P)-dependent dehydrogenase (short-subunit alcohol dehydrogenase family)
MTVDVKTDTLSRNCASISSTEDTEWVDRLIYPSPKNEFWTTPEEIEATIEYLCSNEGGVVNGARLPLFGSS